MSDWINKKAADTEALAPSPELPDLGTVPVTEPINKSLDSLQVERPIRNAPTSIPNQEPVKVLSPEESSKALADAGKELLAAGVSIEKSKASLSKLVLMGSGDVSDQKVISMAKEFTLKADQIKSSIDALSKELSGYQDQVKGPAVTKMAASTSPWLN